MKIFQNKKLSLIVIACIVLLVILVCWLITLQVQRAAFQKKVNELQQLIEEGNFQIEKYKTEKEYRTTWEYIIEQAVEEGMLTPDQLNWIESNLTD